MRKKAEARLIQKAVDMAELLRIYEYYEQSFIRHARDIGDKNRLRRGLLYAALRVKACARYLGVSDYEVEGVLFCGDPQHKDFAGGLAARMPPDLGRRFLATYLVLDLLELRCEEEFSGPVRQGHGSLPELRRLCAELGLAREGRAFLLACTHPDFYHSDAQMAGNTLLLKLATARAPRAVQSEASAAMDVDEEGPFAM